MKNVLWIEDNSLTPFSEWTSPVIRSGLYSIKTVIDATSAINLLSEINYSIVIIDIRLPPGTNSELSRIYRNSNNDKAMAKLGLHIIEWIVSTNVQKRFGKLPKFVDLNSVGIFSVEDFPSIKPKLDALGIPEDRYLRKSANLADDCLLNLIKLLDR
jgi:CheY-like chemotaxis protein